MRPIAYNQIQNLSNERRTINKKELNLYITFPVDYVQLLQLKTSSANLIYSA